MIIILRPACLVHVVLWLPCTCHPVDSRTMVGLPGVAQVEEKLVEKLGRAQEATELQLDHKQIVEQLTSHMESSSQAMALLQQSHSSLQEQLAKLQS